jgi:4-azaleucine resistance transporter AzlC
MAAAAGGMGVTVGAIVAAMGTSPAATIGMSVLVFGGAAQLGATGVAAAAGSPFAVVLTGLLINSRFFVLGLSVGLRLPPRPGYRLVGAQLLSDPSAAVALSVRDTDQARLAYWRVGIVVYVAWVVGTAVGALLGAAIPDPRTFGLDAALPVMLLAFVAPLVTSRRALAAALTGVVVAVALTPLLPLGLPLLAACAAGALFGLGRRRGAVQGQ